MKKALQYYKLIFLILLAFCRCTGYFPEPEKQQLIKEWFFDFENPEAYNKKNGNGIAGSYIRIDSSSIYGYGLNFNIPDSLKNSHLKVVVSFSARLGLKRFGQSLIIGTQSNNKIHYWYPIDLRVATYSKNKWFSVSDSTQFLFNPSDTGRYALKVFGFNPYKYSILDMDNLKIKLIKVDYLKQKRN